MPTYKYEGAYASGERVTGVVEAVSQNDAVAQIRQSCEVVLSLKEVPRAAVRDPLERFQKISAKSLALTCQQFAIILKAGLPLVQTVDLVADQCADKALGRLLRQVSEDVSNGWSLLQPGAAGRAEAAGDVPGDGARGGGVGRPAVVVSPPVGLLPAHEQDP